MVVDKLQQKGWNANRIARKTIWRGFEVFVLGVLFRVQEYVIAWGWAPKSDLFRVDILNTIGISIMLMGMMCWIVGLAASFRNASEIEGQRTADLPHPFTRSMQERGVLKYSIWAAVVAMAISLATPPLWTTWQPKWLPWPIESYINGVHNLGKPQPWLFPIFPWTAFAFAGLAVGFVLQGELGKAQGAKLFAYIGVAGAALAWAAHWIDARPWQIYAVYDFWHTSPSFFLIRLGMLMMIMAATYMWCRWGAGQWGFSPLIQLGQTSLLVYWVHIEFVYGRFTILPSRGVGIGVATEGLIVICISMLLLSLGRTGLDGRGTELWKMVRRPVRRALRSRGCRAAEIHFRHFS
jgi:fucose 4-O-acetylase-like acetyltransferase